MSKQKNYTLELLKLFASYMVVFIHISFYGEMDTVMETLARFAVPLFFLISGYYSYQIEPEKIKKRIKNILNLLILASVCYILFRVVTSLIDGDTEGIVAFFNHYLSIGTWIKILVLNVSYSSVHIWYLLAIAYVYIIFYFITVFRVNEKVILVCSCLLLLLNILLGEGLSVVGITVPIPLVRNFALTGIPFFVLGLFSNKYEDKLRHTPDFAVIIAIVIGIAESLLSRYLFGAKEIYIGSLLILFAVVIVFIKYSTVKYPRFLNALSGCSTYIYIFHIMLSSVIIRVYKLCGFDYHNSVILTSAHPIIVCIVSTIFAYCIIQIQSVLARKKQK